MRTYGGHDVSNNSPSAFMTYLTVTFCAATACILVDVTMTVHKTMGFRYSDDEVPI